LLHHHHHPLQLASCNGRSLDRQSYPLDASTAASKMQRSGEAPLPAADVGINLRIRLMPARSVPPVAMRSSTCNRHADRICQLQHRALRLGSQAARVTSASHLCNTGCDMLCFQRCCWVLYRSNLAVVPATCAPPRRRHNALPAGVR
jgi:hypothetical protein